MATKRYKPERIVSLQLRADVLSSRVRSVSELCQEIRVTENTYYRWRKEYGNMRMVTLQEYGSDFYLINSQLE